VVGHTHGSYADRLLGALECLGVERAIAISRVEGSDVLRPGRPVAVLGHAAGRIDLPERLGLLLRGDCDPEIAADLTRAVRGGGRSRVRSERSPTELRAAGVWGGSRGSVERV
jgi:anthranilate phosphoribosyltransferase